MSLRCLALLPLFCGCGFEGVQSREDGEAASSGPFQFAPASRFPRHVSEREAQLQARSNLISGEALVSVSTEPALGLGQMSIHVVATDGENARAFVIDEDGYVSDPVAFRAREQEAAFQRFGRLSPELFNEMSATPPDGRLDVEVFVYADVPEPQLPYDGTDRYVPIEDYEAWFNAHAEAQVVRIAASKQRIRNYLVQRGALSEDYRGLPILRARLTPAELSSVDINAPDVVRVNLVPDVHPSLLGFAGRASQGDVPSRGGLVGGQCGSNLPCSSTSAGILMGSVSRPAFKTT